MQRPLSTKPSRSPAYVGPARLDRGLTPVPVAPRHDGWTIDRQRAFLLALAETGCVGHAAKDAGMSACRRAGPIAC
jgi:hypothetical protein